MADDFENQTKEQLLKKIGSHTKDELAEALAAQVKKEELYADFGLTPADDEPAALPA